MRTLDEIIEAIGIEPYYRDKWAVIYHADCRDILPLIPDKGIDLVLTDPPYGIGVTKMQLGNRKVKPLYRGENHWDEQPPEMRDIGKLAPNIVIWGGNFFNMPVSRGWLVWDKFNDGTDFADCELAWTNRDAPIRIKRISWNGANAKERIDYDRYHPTQKPSLLMAWCIRFYPKANLILDPFMGSGTTLVAAKTLNRYSIGIEIEEKYCKIAADRLRQSVMELNC